MGALFKNIHTSIMTQIAIGNDIVLNCIAHALGDCIESLYTNKNIFMQGYQGYRYTLLQE